MLDRSPEFSTSASLNAEMTAGAAMFTRLKALGIDYVFCNSGTDFPPIIEGLAEAMAKDVELPEALVIPHEHAAVSMAHGYYFATGKAQAVILHTNVGLANGAIGAINAATDQVPMLLMSGRTPVMEKERFGARTVPIAWGQEMRDQNALVREASKWDYELRFPEQVSEVLDRALAITNSLPKSPVYLSLPREVLCENIPAEGLGRPPIMHPNVGGPDASSIETAARWLSEARAPLIIGQRGAGSAEGFAALAKLAEDWSIPVSQWWASSNMIASDHPSNVGWSLDPFISEADVILVVNSLAPWSPDVHKPPKDAKVIHLGPDPLFSRFPVRNFPSDLSIACETGDGLVALKEAMHGRLHRHVGARMRRKAQLAERVKDIRAANDRAAAAIHPMTKAHVAHVLSEAIEGKGAQVVNELGCPLDFMTIREHQAWRQEPHSGGLGWGLPCAMGMQLANRDRLVVATMGDGSYMFANPVVCHQIMEALDLPLLVIVLNNSEWGAVRKSVSDLYPDGYAAKANRMPLTSLQPSPDFTKVAESCGHYAVRVDQADDLRQAINDAIRHIAEKRKPALLEVTIQ
ncbi:MAG: thiamine pyrophosphate-requiring protein [Aliihoeflea sp.]